MCRAPDIATYKPPDAPPPSHARPPPGVGEKLCGVAATLVMWPLIVIVPLALQSNYQRIWPEAWYSYEPGQRPSPLGLSLGIGAVVVGQLFVLAYQYLRWQGSGVTGPLVPVQPNEYRKYEFAPGAAEHLAQPEGFALIGGYLILTWMLRLMPDSYYGFEGGVDWARVFACLLIQDGLQYFMHRCEHRISKAFYRASHEPHHQFTNPRLFDAFNGSFADTCFMIVIPLFCTKSLVHCNVWTYMAFGSLYANWLCLIHSETHHTWDSVFYLLGFGTAADHHVHHKLFAYNFGHLFMYWDWAGGTYRDPKRVRQFVPNGKAPVPWKPHRPSAKEA